MTKDALSLISYLKNICWVIWLCHFCGD